MLGLSGNLRGSKSLEGTTFRNAYCKTGKIITKTLAYPSLVRLILEYGAGCWDIYKECQISALDRIQYKAAKFAHLSGGSDWESLSQRRKMA
jgi:hypothetical protein